MPGKGSFAAPHGGVDEGRKERLLRSFDEAAAELLFLGVPRQTLCQRIQWAEGGERH